MTKESIASALRFYYRQPQPEQIAHIISAAMSLGMAETRSSRLALIGFMAGLVAGDIQMVDRLAPVFARLPGDEPQRLMRAIVYSGRLDWKEQLGRLKAMWPDKAAEIDRLSAREAKAVYQLKRDGQPEVLDMNWSFFHATGRREPVMSIIDWLGDLRSVEADKVAAAHAARLSLIAHAIEHERVFDICLRSQWGSYGDQLRDIVAAAQIGDIARFKTEADAAIRSASAKPAAGEAQVLTAKSRAP